MCIMRELYHTNLYLGCNITSCSAFDTFVRSNDRYVLLSIYYFLNNFRVSISIASSSELLSLLVVADLDGGSTYCKLEISKGPLTVVMGITVYRCIYF